MATKKTINKVNVDALIKEIVMEKIKNNRRLSKDEHWFYLTRILKFSDEESEEIIKKLKKT
jgi:hypothetical protein